jgi:transcriptional regulator with GAF, ATPase, and Fis domain
VLLDEIGDLPLAAQGKLLRVLQEGEIRRLGESLPRDVDVRVLAATHRDLESMVAKGTFRSDLYYRLKVCQVSLPPLRDRQQDVLLLADHFVSQTGHRLSRRAGERLLQYSWPGNVRELRNILQVAVAMSDGPVVDLPVLELPRQSSDRALGYHAQVDELRRTLVREALSASDGHRARAARRLGVSRQALSYLVKRFGLERIG